MASCRGCQRTFASDRGLSSHAFYCAGLKAIRRATKRRYGTGREAAGEKEEEGEEGVDAGDDAAAAAGDPDLEAVCQQFRVVLNRLCVLSAERGRRRLRGSPENRHGLFQCENAIAVGATLGPWPPSLPPRPIHTCSHRV